MKAALVSGPNQTPSYADFDEPKLGAAGGASEGTEIVSVRAAALTNITKGRAAGSHYSATSTYPKVVGLDGVGRRANGERVFFMMPEAPFGSMAEKVLVKSRHCTPVPEGLDDVAAAALGNPGMSSMAAFQFRAKLMAGETVLVNGATGSAGGLAVQIAKHLGAARVIATGRNAAALEELKALGADRTLNLTLEPEDLSKAFEAEFASGVDVVLDYVRSQTTEAMLKAAARAMPETRALRYVELGNIAGSDFAWPGGLLRAKPIALMGSGLGSVPLANLLSSITDVLNAAGPSKLVVRSRAVPLAEVATTWNAPGNDRVVFVVA